MADEPNVTQEQGSAPQAEAPLPKAVQGKIMPWLITALAVVVCTAGGFLVGRMFGTRGKAQTASAAEPARHVAGAHEKSKPRSEKGEPWFYDIEPIVANLNEPGVTRYVRVALTLEVSNDVEATAGKELLDQKKPLLKHWLTLYLSNQTLEGIRGEKNLRQVQTQMTDALNQGLFPNDKPQIVNVLFKELSIQ
ncbi:MAG: flagellar basal body-associated FliL family protein [Sedimentisphaerales bacterium]|nr:flagellar basal body-associated FliL family protein [Sedimentisphaerales bacterium]